MRCSVARIRRLGITNLQTDDYLMVFAVVWYTILCVALNQVASGGGSNLMNDKDIENLTPAIKSERERGSKWVFVSEHAFILAIWAMKACMLVIYARITYVSPGVLLHESHIAQRRSTTTKVCQLSRYIRGSRIPCSQTLALPHLSPSPKLLGCSHAQRTMLDLSIL